MQPERIEKVKALLASASRCPPSDRTAFLDWACRGDADLRRDIDDYIGSGAKTERFSYQDETLPDVTISSENQTAPVTFAESAADPRIGKEFGKYIIKSRVAEGGMGIVYLALDTQLGREVALKILPAYFSIQGERLARFQREARATSLLNHPNIVTVFEIGQLEGCEFIVTEFVEGHTLRELMRPGPVPFVEMLKIGSQIAGALSAAHKAGVVHRDIKPENVMLRPDGYVKVLDFGLAKVAAGMRKMPSGNVEFAAATDHTIPGMILGTVSYMSPEQAEGQHTDARADIWSLGVLLYEMAAGKPPFKGPTASHTIVAIMEKEPDPIDHASPELRQIISTALQKDRALRFQTAESMGAALDELRQRLGYVSDKDITGPEPTQRTITIVEPRPRSPYRKLAWIVPSALTVLVVAFVGMYTLGAWLLDRSSGQISLPPTNNIVPTPVPTIERNIVVADPSPPSTAATVEPTPIATPARQGREPRPEPEPRRRQLVPETPLRAARTPEPKKPPLRKPKAKQDPNCVFTNTCN